MSDLLLKILTGPKMGYSLPLQDQKEIRIGRKRGTLILQDPLISSEHARLYLRGDTWYIQDLGSTNGVYLSGEQVQDHPIPPDEDLLIGGTTIRITTNQQPIAASPIQQQLNIAWLLDEERVRDLPKERNKNEEIDNFLRLPPSLNAVVEVISGKDKGNVYRCQTGNINIGRKIGEIPLTDQEVSRRHAIIECFGREMIFFRDLESTNGTLHNGEKIQTARLKNGDSIEVGKTVMRFKIL